jgi:hypothetical protein
MSGATQKDKAAAQVLLAESKIVAKLEHMLNELCRAKPADMFSYMVSPYLLFTTNLASHTILQIRLQHPSLPR